MEINSFQPQIDPNKSNTDYQEHFLFNQNFYEVLKRDQMVQKFTWKVPGKYENFKVSEMRTIKPKSPEVKEENQMEQIFLVRNSRKFGYNSRGRPLFRHWKFPEMKTRILTSFLVINSY